jgi:hypothetical protein
MPAWWRAAISPPGASVVKRASSSSSSISSRVRSRPALVSLAAFAAICASMRKSALILVGKEGVDGLVWCGQLGDHRLGPSEMQGLHCLPGKDQ